MRAALEWARAQDPHLGLLLARYLEGFWVVVEPAEGVSWLEVFLAATPDAAPELRDHALRALGGPLQAIAEYDRAGRATKRT